MTDKNWLTPETAIGARLPCGATVVKARARGGGLVVVDFDRPPAGTERDVYAGRVFDANGRHEFRELPNLIPPNPKQAGVYVTRQSFVRAGCEIEGITAVALVRLADALGIPPEPPKQAPWEAAYEAWDKDLAAKGAGKPFPREAWQAGMSWAVTEACDAVNIGGPNYSMEQTIRRRIMGDAK